jgi:hypothetical protein
LSPEPFPSELYISKQKLGVCFTWVGTSLVRKC